MAFPSVIDVSTLDGSDGFRADGTLASGRSGHSVAGIGDVNDDGFDDLLIGSPLTGAGRAHVLFGGPTIGTGGEIALSGFDGSTGFQINGACLNDATGWSVAGAGDINGDGIADLVIGAKDADPNGDYSGAAFVLFGDASIGSGGTVELSALGAAGFRLNGFGSYHYTGVSVASAGDINGDGIDDLLIGAFGANSYAGRTYVVFGAADIGTGGAIELSSLNGSNGFRIEGNAASARSGWSVSGIGDVNDDGFDDILIGSPRASPGAVTWAGSSYVVFGSDAATGGVLALSDLDGTNGFRLDGVGEFASTGYSVGAAGDINGDGIPDLVVGAPGASGANGATYVVFGAAGLGGGGVLDLATLDGTAGFRLDGSDQELSGNSVGRAGDINGDGIDDLLIGAPFNGVTGGPGRAYVVFGATGIGAGGALVLADLVAEGKASRIDGNTANSMTGWAVAAAGDVNGDGGDDLVIGARFAAPDALTQAGSSYVLFGLPPQSPPPPPPAPGPPPPPGSRPNAAPEAGDDHFAVRWNSPLVVPAPGVLDNDRDSDGDRLAVTGLVEGPRHGQIEWLPDGGFRYVPNAAFVGSDSFTYRVADPRGAGDTATVHIDVFDDGKGVPLLPVTGGPGSERLVGTHLADTVHGHGGDDTITGGGGRDQLHGGPGDDVVLGEGDEDVVWGGPGNDLVDGGQGNDWALGDLGDDTVHGGPGNDHVWGGRGGDVLFGDAGNDVVDGGFGNDTISGGTGNDLLRGGDGEDLFRFAEGDGLDRILDFAPGTDRILIDTGGDGVLNGIALAGFADLLARMVDAPGGVFLALDDSLPPVHGITIEGVSRDQLSEADFLFL